MQAYASVFQTGIFDESIEFPKIKIIKKELTAIRKTNSRIASVDREFQDAIINRAFDAIKRRESEQKLHFKSQRRFKTIKMSHADRTNRVRILPNGRIEIYISKEIGYLRLRNNRQIPKNFTEISLTIKNDKYYVIFHCKRDTIALPKIGKSVGLDAGITHILVGNEGFLEENLYHLHKNKKMLEKKQAKLVAAQQKLEAATIRDTKRKVINYDDKTRLRLAKGVSKAFEKIDNFKSDFYHKLSRSLVNVYDFIVIEDLSLKEMKENGAPAQRAGLHEVALGRLYKMLCDKAESAGRRVLKINPAYTSQDCSKCGFRDANNRSGENFECRKCNFKEHADINAARNILKKGLVEASKRA